MRKIDIRKCVVCGNTFSSLSNNQKYCCECKKIKQREWKRSYYIKNNPNAYMKNKTDKEVCCICGGEFSSHYNGKPYCNKHYLRMKNNGTSELKGRKSTNEYIIGEDYCKVICKNGAEITIDIEDLDKIKICSWCISKTGYAVGNINGKVTKMHRYIIGDKCNGMVIDHINRNKLDNRKSNLRICRNGQNVKNQGNRKNNTSGHRGVGKLKNGKYRVRISHLGKEKIIGLYDDYESAVLARKQAELEEYGEFSPYYEN